ncbi:hypothetical protein ABZ756_13895 [Mammaliicoccus sciuri]
MDAFEEMLTGVRWVLDNRTSYRTAQDLGISNRTANRYQNGESPIENMSLKTAKVFYDYYKGEIEMENKINEIIAAVENLKVELEEGYVIGDNNVISHRVEDEDLTVYFAEKQFVQDAREEGTAEELLEELNGLDDRFNYDKVIGYDAGHGVVWL